MKTLFAKIGVELQSLEHILTEHLWDEMQHWLHPRSPQPTRVSDPTIAHVAEWANIPKAMLQNIVESLHRIVVVIITAKGK